MKNKIVLYFFVTVLFAACDFGNDNSTLPSSNDADYEYVDMVQTYRQELFTSNKRNTNTGLFETRWVFYEDEICPLYKKHGQQYVKWNGKMCKVFSISEEMFPEENANGFTRTIDTKGGTIILLR